MCGANARANDDLTIDRSGLKSCFYSRCSMPSSVTNSTSPLYCSSGTGTANLVNSEPMTTLRTESPSAAEGDMNTTF